jgi:hypothetical protein
MLCRGRFLAFLVVFLSLCCLHNFKGQKFTRNFFLFRRLHPTSRLPSLSLTLRLLLVCQWLLRRVHLHIHQHSPPGLQLVSQLTLQLQSPLTLQLLSHRGCHQQPLPKSRLQSQCPDQFKVLINFALNIFKAQTQFLALYLSFNHLLCTPSKKRAFSV